MQMINSNLQKKLNHTTSTATKPLHPLQQSSSAVTSNQLNDHGGAQLDATWRFLRLSNTLAIAWRMVWKTKMNMPVLKNGGRR